MEDSNYLESDSDLQAKVLEQFKSGKNLFGKDGAFAPLLKQFLENALDAEMSSHLDSEERLKGNKRNGRATKKVKSSVGEFELSVPTDRHSSFTPEVVKKREVILADNLADKIIGLYGLGTSYRDISAHIKEIYDSSISHSVLTSITDRIIPDVKAWQNRPLEAVYCIVWLDAMHYKVKVNGTYESRAVYNILGVNTEGKKEVIGMYVSQSEGAKFWLQVLSDLQARGLQDILIACTDNLKGFTQAIKSVYPKAVTQLCVVHQIRNSIKYVASKDKKDFMKDLKTVYQATSREIAQENLELLDEKWGDKYPVVIKSWRANWEELTQYFDFSIPIRKLIYTTNAVEGFHRQIRKVTKTKGAFTSDMALLKIMYLATQNIHKKWNSPIHNWGTIIQQLYIQFQDRIKLKLNL